MTTKTLVTQGNWNNIPWQFMADSVMPDLTLSTAAFCIVTFQGKLVLVEHHSRGFEFSGGHVDPEENILDTVIREVREESRAIITNPIFFGYKQISPAEPIPHRDKPGHFYPFPHSYIHYYWAEASHLDESEPLAADVKSVRLADYEEALQLLEPGHNHDKILDFLVKNTFFKI